MLEHIPMIMIVSRYNQYRKISVAKHDWSERAPTSLCENKRQPPPKEITPDLSVLIFIWDVILELEFSTHTVLNGEFSDVSEYNSSIGTISSHISTT